MIKKKLSTSGTAFSQLLLSWNARQNTRQMPWKGEKDPYKIWLSEIILQQTRVEQGLGYYQRFVKAYPDIRRLAKASDTAVFKLWEGLGYYSRCRNLLFTARHIAGTLAGRFPESYEEIRALKGIGPYTAAAIASFAYNLPYAVVDGNVFRVLARVFGLSLPIDSAEGKKEFTRLAEELLDKKQPGLYNQAIMDFGAVVCKPAAPLCSGCVFSQQCVAFLQKKVNELPVKEKKISIKKRWFNYFLLETTASGLVAIRERTAKDIWQGLHEFPLLEAGKDCSVKELVKMAEENKLLSENGYDVLSVSSLIKQQLSHQLITGRFIHIRIYKKPAGKNDWQWVKKTALKKYAFPQFINQYLRQEANQGSLF